MDIDGAYAYTNSGNDTDMEPADAAFSRSVPIAVDHSSYHRGQPSVVVEPSPAEFPQWANLEPFAFASLPEPSTATQPMHHSFQGFSGTDSAFSSFDPLQAGIVDMHRSTQTTLEEWYESRVPPAPDLSTNSILDQLHNSSIDEFFQVQQHNTATLDTHRSKGRSKGKSKSAANVPVPTEDEDGVITYDGSDTSCSICQHDFSDDEWCARLACRLVFYTECFNDIIAREHSPGTERCPNCRGTARLIARFRYIAPAQQPVFHGISTPANSRAASTDSFRSAMQAFPWHHPLAD